MYHSHFTWVKCAGGGDGRRRGIVAPTTLKLLLGGGSPVSGRVRASTWTGGSDV